MPDPPLPDCPHLPSTSAVLTAAAMRGLGADRGERFYEAALLYAQSLWRHGYPARSLLLLNRAMGCALDGSEPAVQRTPIPYPAVAWILAHRLPSQFIGNPRRHWQHLATRVVAPRRELRAWRAWSCWALARRIMPEMPADEIQLRADRITEPTEDAIRDALASLGLPGEAALWSATAAALPPPRP